MAFSQIETAKLKGGVRVEDVRAEGEWLLASGSYLKTFEQREAGWVFGLRDGRGFGIPKPEDVTLLMPRSGDRVALIEWKNEVRVLVVEGYVFAYRTEAECLLAATERVAQMDARKQATLEEMRSEFTDREAALPVEIAGRLRALRERSILTEEEWNRTYWGYELFVCEEAAKMVAAVRDGSLDWDRFTLNEVKFPELSDQHSGNTFGASVYMANLILTHDEPVGSDLVNAMSAAMAQINGSRESG